MKGPVASADHMVKSPVRSEVSTPFRGRASGQETPALKYLPNARRFSVLPPPPTRPAALAIPNVTSGLVPTAERARAGKYRPFLDRALNKSEIDIFALLKS